MDVTAYIDMYNQEVHRIASELEQKTVETMHYSSLRFSSGK